MFKFTVEQVLEIIQSLTAEEKAQLSAELPDILAIPATLKSGIVQNRSMSVGGDFQVSGTGVTVDFSQTQSGTETQRLQSTVGTAEQPLPIAELLAGLAQLQEAIAYTPLLNPSQKTEVQTSLKMLESEIQKPQPDKGLVQRTIDTLKQGLEGVLLLAEPTLKVADLVSKAWFLI
jgi:hypothetical protein